MKLSQLFPFRGLFTTLGLDCPPPHASSLLNVRVGDGKIRPRYGYRTLQAPIAGEEGVYGFQYLAGYDDSYVLKEEWVSLERVAGVVKPYSLDVDTAARTEITDGGTTLNLAASLWQGFSFNGASYWCNPASATSVYKHSIGDATSWSALNAIPNASPTGTVTVQIDPPPYLEQSVFDHASDTVTGTITGSIGTGTWTIDATTDKAQVALSNTPTGSYAKGSASIEVTLAAVRDFSKAMAMMAHIEEIEDTLGRSNNDGYASDQTNTLYLENSAGTNATVTGIIKGDLDVASGSYYAWYDISGVSSAILDDIKKIEVKFGVYKTGNATFRLSELKTGGVRFHDLTGSFKDATGSNTASLEYAFNYTEGLTVGTASPVNAIDSAQHLGSIYYTDLPFAGSNTVLTVPLTTDGFTTSAKINLYRKVGADWQRIAQRDNDANLVFRDDLRDSVVSADTTTYPVATLSFDPPAFVRTGVKSGFAYKGWVIWLYPGGEANVRHSKIGDAETTLDVNAVWPDQADETRPANFTLADNFGDEPIGGVQAGQTAIVLGSQGVYAQAGNSPSEMTPFRKVPGSLGCAGPFAFARFRSDAGEPGVAFLDASGEGVWFVGSFSIFSSDAQTRPVELSEANRGYPRSFLLDPQRDEFGYTDMSQARMDVDEHTNSLWIVMGRRALVLRPKSPFDETRHWEAYEFAQGV